MNPKKTFSKQPASSVPARPPTQEQIAALAHAIWLDRGQPEGRDVDNWLEAERQLRGEIRTPAAADDLPADPEALEPEATLEGRFERETRRIATPGEQRSPTSL